MINDCCTAIYATMLPHYRTPQDITLHFNTPTLFYFVILCNFRFSFFSFFCNTGNVGFIKNCDYFAHAQHTPSRPLW